MSFNELIYKNIIENETFASKSFENIESVKITSGSIELLEQLLDENPGLKNTLDKSANEEAFLRNMKEQIKEYFKSKPDAFKFCMFENKGRRHFEALDEQDIAAIRLHDYLENEGREFTDLNLRGEKIISRPFKLLWLAYKKETGGANAHFFIDMIYLFRQYKGEILKKIPDKNEIEKWMDRHPSGLDPEIIKMRDTNKERIINIIINKIDSGEIKDKRFYFESGKSYLEKKQTIELEWWNDRLFHLRFAIRDPDLLNEMLDYTLNKNTMQMLYEARDAGIPFFVNPYYLSLVNVNEPAFAKNADLAIRQYVIYSRQLIDEYGHIVAWEKEDIVEPGKPNAAGWILPSSYNIHRRYPEVAILIPDTIGRACGGLCASCQRMYDFQRGHLNFDLDKLKPKETWPEKLHRLMAYFETDSQLRDILITGGDALMSSDRSLKRLLDEVYEIAKNKIQNNQKRPFGKKYAEMVRVRLGTRLPVYLPQRITPELVDVLSEFKQKASKIGIKQFVIQTHYETAMEITPESREAVRRLLSAGWIVTNQQVFTSAASRRGHTAKLRKVLNEIGVLPYYTFSVKGYIENSHNFATNERSVQEQYEEKIIGAIPVEYFDKIRKLSYDAENMIDDVQKLKEELNIPFLATDRNVLNLPGVGKSLTYRTIGITHDGRRILEFDHDSTRWHSPIIHKMGKVIIIESKSLSSYLWQLHKMDEDISEYSSIFNYSINETETRMPVFEYPEYDYKVTQEITNIEIT